ncbi:gephyrin [Colias croceus]|uniref:gephyrin n=1 Tax=Colias crocea TaxID=72248 RepID=UPI001E27DD2B|nr:gephyrin [Colias croceus]XP_045503650.1 gephyrin [Colias croceus]XP_045503652.1 gephyrin [Colias croceus]XP_045503653.1 gephyrin [Colias croceus]
MVKGVVIITVSDTCFKDHSKDESGPALVQLVKEKFPDAYIHTIIIPDEKEIIERELKYFCDSNVDLILTTGGTGLSSRDVTPEATKAVIQREVPAIPIAMTLESLKKTPMAMLSRATAGIRDRTLIVNFPGSKKAVIECIEVVKPVLSHAVSLLANDLTEVKLVHDKMQAEDGCPHKMSKVDISKVALRDRESPYPMLEMSVAFNTVDAVMMQWIEGVEMVAIEDSIGRVAAQAILAKEPMPPFPASVKDGYACLSYDGAGIRHVRSVVTAGDTPPAPLVSGECARVNTGAPIPAGADCVVQVEDTALIKASDNHESELEVEILVAPKPHQDVRPIGFDIPLGAMLLEKGDVIDAAKIGILAGAGYLKVPVRTHPKVSILSTGNELQEPSDEVLRPSHIRDSNRIMLKMLLKEHGYESTDCGIARDEPGALAAAIARALPNTDILVCTGGVSMGERDLLKPVLVNDFNATIHFGRVRMKPGKPSTFATCVYQGKTKFIFALPGNPVSAYVCCLLFVLRALRQCTRYSSEFARMRVRLARDVTLDPRPEYARAVLEFPPGDQLPVATVLGNQCSSRLLSASGASVLLELPGATEKVKHLPADTIVPALITGRIDLTRP